MIKIHVLHTGRVKVDEALPFRTNSLNPLDFTGLFRSKEHKIWLPVSIYLIEHPKGLILLDTGWLLSLGYTSKDLVYIILSHLDGDHAGGLQLVKEANNILVSSEELEASKG